MSIAQDDAQRLVIEKTFGGTGIVGPSEGYSTVLGQQLRLVIEDVGVSNAVVLLNIVVMSDANLAGTRPIAISASASLLKSAKRSSAGTSP